MNFEDWEEAVDADAAADGLAAIRALLEPHGLGNAADHYLQDWKALVERLVGQLGDGSARGARFLELNPYGSPHASAPFDLSSTQRRSEDGFGSGGLTWPEDMRFGIVDPFELDYEQLSRHGHLTLHVSGPSLTAERSAELAQFILEDLEVFADSVTSLEILHEPNRLSLFLFE